MSEQELIYKKIIKYKKNIKKNIKKNKMIEIKIKELKEIYKNLEIAKI